MKDVNELGLKLLCLPTHFLNSEGEWLSTAEQDVDPIFELANKYNLAIQIHPYDGENDCIKKPILEISSGLMKWLSNADTLHSFTLRDLPNKYSNIRTSFAHGAMLAIANYGEEYKDMMDVQISLMNYKTQEKHWDMKIYISTH